ncbi:TPA: hypothetical protein N0F65_008315 [Lagenidium giganteum]|uniref:Uncharacterized protein n=1 Tax=Lagenidium giganteum TaxID=4803 RepID=A0AAV2YSS9_9STRA|nr:TPA: hypothetical protein N0F65_008315 [Lagenidium giganteum]
MSAAATAMTERTMTPTIPRDSIYDLQRSLGGVDVLAYLAPADGFSDKKPCKWVEVAFHPVRPWVATIEAKGLGAVWNYETREIVLEFSLEISTGQENAEAGDDDDDGAGAGAAQATPTATTTSRSLLQRSGSPTTSYVRPLRSKQSSLRMLFYDHEAIASTTKTAHERTCFDEWLVILTSTHVVLCDINQNSAIRSISPDDLQRQMPTSVEILPGGLIGVGCQDGKLRIWSPSLWRTVETVDTGSARELQHLVLVPGGDSSHLVGSTLDGKVVAWKVSPIGSGCECVRVNDVELKDYFKAFDTGNSLMELKFHALQEVVSGTSKDGTSFFFDVAPLIRLNKPMPLVGILPPAKAQGAIVLPSTRKSAFMLVSIAPSGTTLMVSELMSKGRVVGKDNTPSSFHEFGVACSYESRDVRHHFSQLVQKKLKIVALTSSVNSASDFCCMTNYGMLVLQLSCLPSIVPIMVTRGAEKAPLVAFPSVCRVVVRFYNEETSSKQEDYKLQSGMDAPNEKMRIPTLETNPVHTTILSALLPASTHVEILQMDSELKNQKSINFHMAFSGNAIAVAWHAQRSRFALLVPQEPNARRLTRATSSAVPTPKRRAFMFGGSKGNNEDGAESARLRNAMARVMSLAIYDVSKDGHVELVDDNCGPDDHMLHIFSGPLLGIVRYEADDEGLTGSDAAGKPGGDHHDSPSARNKRTESNVFATTPTSAAVTAAAALSSSGSTPTTDATTDIKKTYLEFYDWDNLEKQTSRHQHGQLKKVGTAVDCPLNMAWEQTTKRFCALVYPQCIKIYRVSRGDEQAFACLHEIPTPQAACSIKWFHHTLFVTTDDTIKCFVVCKTRYFTFDLASHNMFGEPNVKHFQQQLYEFPRQQFLPLGAHTILGVRNQALVVAGPTQALHLVDLSNKVLQCCLLISIGQADLAVKVAEAFSPDLREWIASVLEAFGFVAQALALSTSSLRQKIDLCVKHNLLDELPSLLSSTVEDSESSVGTSPYQRGCTTLHRAGRVDALKVLLESAKAAQRLNDEIFLSSLLRDTTELVDRLRASRQWAPAFHVVKNGAAKAQGTELMKHWNQDLTAANAPWKHALDQQEIRSPQVSLVP